MASSQFLRLMGLYCDDSPQPYMEANSNPESVDGSVYYCPYTPNGSSRRWVGPSSDQGQNRLKFIEAMTDYGIKGGMSELQIGYIIRAGLNYQLRESDNVSAKTEQIYNFVTSGSFKADAATYSADDSKRPDLIRHLTIGATWSVPSDIESYWQKAPEVREFWERQEAARQEQVRQQQEAAARADADQRAADEAAARAETQRQQNQEQTFTPASEADPANSPPEEGQADDGASSVEYASEPDVPQNHDSSYVSPEAQPGESAYTTAPYYAEPQESVDAGALIAAGTTESSGESGSTPVPDSQVAYTTVNIENDPIEEVLEQLIQDASENLPVITLKMTAPEGNASPVVKAGFPWKWVLIGAGAYYLLKDKRA